MPSCTLLGKSRAEKVEGNVTKDNLHLFLAKTNILSALLFRAYVSFPIERVSKVRSNIY